MDNPKVQIIVPVYNAQKYLKRCLDSLVNQTYKNWEAILINDASMDKSEEIINEYKNKDNRFIYIPLEKNCGVSNVRNLGLEKLNEKYTAFLDSDDYWESDMLEILVGKAEEKDFDVVQCRYIYDFPRGKQLLPNGAYKTDVELCEKNMKKAYLKMMTGINMNHVCMKLIKTELIKDLRFDTKLKTAEDLQFSVKLFCSVKKFCFINKALYHYCRNEDSLTGKGLSAKEKLKANRMVAKDMIKALPSWNMDNVFYRMLCRLRPYIIIFSKTIRILKEKIFTKNER